MDFLVSRRFRIWTSSPGFKEVPFRGSLNPLNRWTFWPFKERCVRATRRISLSWSRCPHLATYDTSMKNIFKGDLHTDCKGTYIIQLRVTPKLWSTMILPWALKSKTGFLKMAPNTKSDQRCNMCHVPFPAERGLIGGISNCFDKSWHTFGNQTVLERQSCP